MNTLRTGKLWIALMLTVLLALLFVACTKEPVKPYNPFKLDIGYAELTGYTDGFMPGNTYEFDLTIRNDTEEAWQGKYCLFLVDEKEIVLEIGGDSFNLPQEGSFTRTVLMVVPDGFADGAYGLTLVIPDRGASVTTIRIGENLPQAVGPFLDVTTCPE